jgi:predicted metalloprotease
MKWQGRRKSRNIEDRRRMSAGKAGGVGGIGLIAVLLIGAFFGVDMSALLDNSGTGNVTQGGGGELTAADRKAGDFVSVVLADTEEIWTDIFKREIGERYSPAVLVLFKGATQSPCGGATGATGPFYCPGDKKVYLDTAFFTTLSRKLGAKGDFAAAYVVAHEVAHHVQDELGILSKANAIRQRVDTAQSNAISVRIELQADCYSGIWARHAKERFGTLERGDIAEAMNAAKQIGDDTLQRNAGRRPMPHTFTHGTSEQRQRWFRKGYDSPEIGTCDTFGTERL